ncbi:MAG: histidine triad nucleotide-binding protein [Hydrogenobaculum sp.]|nr:MAG: histidine triad nucleotide-binding protein [Hydrogenobaculum sp.]PMP89692.1 MAG: histidine triad nucleotide-binding protein [Hydrogenobaculum sp.]
MECIFCKIANKEIKSDIVYEDELLVAFKDIKPVAPTHVLIIPKKHIDGVQALKEEDEALVGKMIVKAKEIADQLGLKEGYRLVFNIGEHGGQTINHIHLHVIGGRPLMWPPG